MNSVIEQARKNNRKFYDNNIEKALETVDEAILKSSECGNSNTIILLNQLMNDGNLIVAKMFEMYTDRLIMDIADHLQIDIDKIKRIYSIAYSEATTVNAVQINWGDVDAE